MTISLTRPDAQPGPHTALIEAGYLIDVTERARRFGFRHSVAIDRDAWSDSVHWDDAIEERKRHWSAQTIDGRLCDVLWAAWLAVKEARRGRRVEFTLNRVPTTGRDNTPKDVTLAVQIVADDQGRPTLTISKVDPKKGKK